MSSILRSIVGNLLGLDKDGNLLIRGKKLILDHAGTPVEVTVSGAQTVSVSAALAASQNNYAPTDYIAGITNRLVLTAALGGSTMTGLLAAPEGFQIRIFNLSSTDEIDFPHQSGSSAVGNRFLCPGGTTNTLGPRRGTTIEMVSGNWMFLS